MNTFQRHSHFRSAVAVITTVLLSIHAFAWGPHTEIAQAAPRIRW
jgi:hypothetical protein